MIDFGFLSNIIGYLTTIIICIVFKFVMKTLTDQVKSDFFSNMFLAMITILLASIHVFNQNNNILKNMIFLICILSLYSKVVYNINWLKSIIHTSIFIYNYKIINYILFWIVIKINSKHYNYSIIEIETFIVTSIFLIFSIKLVNKFKNISNDKIYYVFVVIAILGNIITTIFSFMVKKSIFYYDNVFLNILAHVTNNMLPWIMTICNILLVLVVKKIIDDTNIKAENKIIKEKVDMQYKYYLGVQESQSKVKRLYHDMNNHMICMKSICENKDMADKYISSLNKEINGYKNLFNSGNVILDIILNEKKSICDKNNIELDCDVNFSKCDFIEMVDICSIFSNILDNAIEASNKILDKNIKKYINIRGTIVKKYFIVKCENNKINSVVIKKNKFITDKKDKELHGLGLESIKQSVEKYSGNLEVEDLENRFVIKLYIPLKLKYDSYAN